LDEEYERVHKMVVAFAAKWMSMASLSDIYVVPWHAMFMVFARTVAECKERHKTETCRTLLENERSIATWAHKFDHVTHANVFFLVPLNDILQSTVCDDQKRRRKADFKKYDNDLIILFYNYIDTIFVGKACQTTYYNIWTEVYRRTKAVNP